MIVGVSPASTGGGIKTTSFGILLIAVWNELCGRGESIVMCRRRSRRTERRAFALSFLYLTTILIATVVPIAMEYMDLEAVLFEVVSTIGTVGLSLGVALHFSEAGKTILIILMFWGKLEYLHFHFSGAHKEKKRGAFIPRLIY